MKTAVQLSEIDARYRSLFDHNPDAVYSLNCEGRLISANAAYEKLTGYGAAESAGMNFAALVSPEYLAVNRANFQRALAGETVQLDTEGVRKDGSHFDVAITHLPIVVDGVITGVFGIGKDISVRKAAERLLRDNELRLSLSFAEAATGIATTAIDGRFLDANPAFCRLVGYTLAELRELGLLAITHPDDCTANQRLIREALTRDPGTYTCEKRYVRKDGGIVSVRASVSVARAENRAPLHLVGIFEDITEQRAASEALYLNQSLLEVAGRVAQLGGWSLELPGRQFVWSDRVAAIHDEPAGFSPSLDEGIDYYIPEHRDRIRAAVERCLADGTPYTLELEKVTRGGRRFWTRTIGQAERDANGKIVRLMGAFQDITVSKQAELTLQQQRAEMRVLFDLIPVMIWFKDTENQILLVNQRVADHAGMSVSEIEGRPSAEIYPADAARFYADDLLVIQSGAPKLGYVETVAVPGGQTFWVLTDKVPYRDESGKVIGIVVMATDVTERMREQEELRDLNAHLEHRVIARSAELDLARQEAEQASQAKSTFLATMSHEIRTPMNGVLGMIEVLQQTSLKGDQVEMVDLIRDSAFSLLRIIDDILDFSKIEAGKLSVESEPVHLAQLVESACAMLDHLAAKQAVRLTVFVDPLIPPMVSGDEGRLRQVLVNVISNAIKFSSGRASPGQVSVRALLVERKAEEVTVDLVVEDNGIGIDEQTLARLFTPFSQADSSTTRRFGGTGLGLMISDLLVRLMEGSISVRSTPGKGSTFSVRLHFATREGLPNVDSVSAPVYGLRCRVVGTEQPLAGDCDAYLTAAGATVEHSPDLAAAALADAAPGRCLWLILPSQPVRTADELRVMVAGRTDVETRFVVLGHGSRRQPRVVAVDLVTVDADTLFRKTLFDALTLAAGSTRQGLLQDTQPGSSDAAPRAPLRHDAQRHGRPLLVAEDNETNRAVILQQLRLIGWAAEVVVNGREALEQWRSGDYALLLTDLHMPEMDGYALAAAIRAEEDGGRHTPIIALTANAQRDEEAHCLAMGMDAYLTKPVRLTQLKETIEHWLSPAASAPKLFDSQPALSSPVSPVDLNVLAALVGDDELVIQEILQAFRVSASASAADLRSGAASGSKQLVADAAYKLKSGARSIGALSLGELCAAVEAAAAVVGAGMPQPLLARWEAELSRVQTFLDGRCTAATIDT